MASFRTGKRVLVTGGAGFLGSFRAAQLSGLVARTPLEEGLRTTIGWYRDPRCGWELVEADDPQHARGRHW